MFRQRGSSSTVGRSGQMFQRGDLGAVESREAWVAAAQLQLQHRDYDGAHTTAGAALRHALAGGAAAAGNATGQAPLGAEEGDGVVAALRLVLAECLIRKGQLEQAGAALSLIAGALLQNSALLKGKTSLLSPSCTCSICTRRVAGSRWRITTVLVGMQPLRCLVLKACSRPCGGIVASPFFPMCCAGDAERQAPETLTRLQRRALRGLAQVALARGDAAAAEQLYRRILGPAVDLPARQQPQAAQPAALSASEHILGIAPTDTPAAAATVGEHWAHGDYGWLLFEQGRTEVCRPVLTQPSLLQSLHSGPQRLTLPCVHALTALTEALTYSQVCRIFSRPYGKSHLQLSCWHACSCVEGAMAAGAWRRKPARSWRRRSAPRPAAALMTRPTGSCTQAF